MKPANHSASLRAAALAGVALAFAACGLGGSSSGTPTAPQPEANFDGRWELTISTAEVTRRGTLDIERDFLGHLHGAIEWVGYDEGVTVRGFVEGDTLFVRSSWNGWWDGECRGDPWESQASLQPDGRTMLGTLNLPWPCESSESIPWSLEGTRN